jgi:predicted ester cyclase
MTAPQDADKAALAPLRRAMRDMDRGGAQTALAAVMAPDAPVRMAHPFGTLEGPDALWEACHAPLLDAMPDLERRDWIVMAGCDDHGANWVGCAGHWVGTFAGPFLGIPPTGHLAHMRFHEFYRMEGGRIVEIQAIWDLPELMMQAGVWPMAPSLGREMRVPGPATQDGLVPGPWDAAASEASRAQVLAMLEHLTRHPREGGPEVMEMHRFWHPRMTWYGPAGIGTARGIRGFRNWHQIPFLNAMPDRGFDREAITYHFFGDRSYVGVTGWPNMVQTVSGGGWLGIAPSGRRITLRSLDFWRIEDGLIRENWVLVDLLDVFSQLGVDVLGRMAEMAKARVPGRVPFPVGEP